MPEAESGRLRVVVGLGNPGSEYQFTPHNLGFLVVDRLAAQAGVGAPRRPEARSLTAHTQVEGWPVVLAKPLTYMNLSGLAVRELLKKFEVGPAALVVVYDELDLPAGVVRIRERGSAAGHHGMESVLEALGTDEFLRVRLGIQPGHPLEDATGFLLRPYPRSAGQQVEELVERGAEAVRAILRDGPARAMTEFNRRDEQKRIEEQ